MARVEELWESRNRSRVLLVTAVIVFLLAVADWATKSYISLGFLYLLPIIFSAGILPRWAVVCLGIACAILSELFGALDPAGAYIRLVFETIAFTGAGLLVSEMVRNRRLTFEAQERMRVLVETSPAAIVTIDEAGSIEVANRAAADLFCPRDGQLTGHPIAAFLPKLHQALRREEGPHFRTSMQCQGHRDNGEPFMADVWFSTYKEGEHPKLAAIIVEANDESYGGPLTAPQVNDTEGVALNGRESGVLRFLVQGLSNKEIAASMEVTESTVKNTLQQLFSKTGVRTRSQIVRVALERYRNLL